MSLLQSLFANNKLGFGILVCNSTHATLRYTKQWLKHVFRFGTTKCALEEKHINMMFIGHASFNMQ